jgi:hypothetical protein
VAPISGGFRPAERFAFVLVCYFDDSGTDKQSPFVTIAGYVAFLNAWDAFERIARAYLEEKNISCVHAKEFYSNDGEFKNWTINCRLEFLEGLYELLRPQVQLGISISCLKSQFVARKENTGLSKRQSPYGFAFTAAMNVIVGDGVLGPTARREGISFVLEDGNKNNSGIIKSYRRIKEQHKADFLKCISVVGKRSCVAIQMADLMAFFTRRQACAMEANGREPVDFDRYLVVMRKGIRDIGHAITDFQPACVDRP